MANPYDQFDAGNPYDQFDAPVADPTFGQFLKDIALGRNLARQDVGRATVGALPEIGAIVGGMAGAPAGWVGSAAGTALGTSLGTSARQLIENITGEQKRTPVQTLAEQGVNVGLYTGLDLGGSGLAGLLNKGLKWASPAIREGSERSQQLLQTKGGTLSGAQVAESSPIELAEAYARSGAGGKHAFLQLDKKNAFALDTLANDIVRSASSSPVSDVKAGKIFQSVIQRGDDAHKLAANQLYANLDNALVDRPVFVDATPVKAMATDILDRLSKIADIGKTEAGGRLIERLTKLDDTLSFGAAHDLRSELLQTARDLKTAGNEGSALRYATTAAKQIDGAMERAAMRLSPELFDQYRGASSFWKRGKEAFDNDLITKLMQTQPERVGETLFRTGNVSEITQARASLRQAQRFVSDVPGAAPVSAKDTFEKLQSGYLRGMFGAKAATNPAGETLGLNILKDLATTKTDRTFNAMFSPEQRKSIADFGQAALLAMKNKPAGFGTLAPIVQASAALDLASGALGGPSTDKPWADIGILVSPYVLARMLTNPRTANLLVSGLKLPAGSGELASVTAKLTAAANNATQDLLDEMKKQQ